MPSKTVIGQTIHYEESGRGTPLVLLHGFPLDSRIWTKQREALGDRYRVITPDLRGFGQSPSVHPFFMADLADDVHNLLMELGEKQAIIGGLSMGGYVALEFARRFPAAMKGLILIDTRADGDSPEGKQARDKMIELVRVKGSAAVAEQMMPRMLAPEAEKSRPAVAHELRKIMESCGPITIEHALVAMRERLDHSSHLPSIPVPTLIIVGEHDAITPPAMAQAMHAAIPHSELTIIKGAGHMTPMEQPEQVNRALREFHV